jgi:hypothetical protein
MDLDYTITARDFDYALEKAYKKDLERGCGVDVMGQSHGQKPNVFCVNEDYDGSDTYCKVQLISDLERQKDAYEWLPSMLDYYWQNGLGTKGVRIFSRLLVSLIPTSKFGGLPTLEIV